MASESGVVDVPRELDARVAERQPDFVVADRVEEPVDPVPLKISLYVVSGLWPVAATIPADEERQIAVRIGVTIPPARW